MDGWVRKSPKLCWRNIWMVPYPNFGNWWKVARVHLRDRIFFLKKGILWYPVGNLLLYVFSTIEASGTIIYPYSRNLLFLMYYFRNFKPLFLTFAASLHCYPRFQNSNASPDYSDAVSGWSGWAIAHPEFGSSVNPFSTKGGGQIIPTTLLLAHPDLKT